MTEKKLYKILSKKQIGGVCAGLGEHLGIEPIIFRIAFIVLFFCGGAGLLIYLLFYFCLPKKPE